MNDDDDDSKNINNSRFYLSDGSDCDGEIEEDEVSKQKDKKDDEFKAEDSLKYKEVASLGARYFLCQLYPILYINVLFVNWIVNLTINH